MPTIKQILAHVLKVLLRIYFILASIVMIVWVGSFIYILVQETLPSRWETELAINGLYFGLAIPVYILTVILPISRRYHARVKERIDGEITAAGLDPDKVGAIVRTFRQRATGLRLASWFALFLTFIAIAVGLYLFAIAGTIASKDYSARAERAAQQQKEFQLGVDMTLRQYAYNQTYQSSEAAQALTELRKAIEEEAKTVNESVRALDPSEQKGNIPLYLLLSTISTRIGSVLLLIFLVQILISVYRYSVRLQAYYDARADALLLAHQDGAPELQQLVAIMSPERLGFGKPPATPTENMLEMIKVFTSGGKAAKDE
jgi:hypothetical protein